MEKKSQRVGIVGGLERDRNARRMALMFPMLALLSELPMEDYYDRQPSIDVDMGGREKAYRAVLRKKGVIQYDFNGHIVMARSYEKAKEKAIKRGYINNK